MALELVSFKTVLEGLKKLDKPYSMEQNLVARVETPILKDRDEDKNRISLWKTPLDSKTPNLYGGKSPKKNEDNRHRFKIDHFGLSTIVNAHVNSDGSISIDEPTYDQSQGTEFMTIDKEEIKGAKVDYLIAYAIRANKYQNISEQLNNGRCKSEDLEKAGGFKIVECSKPEEIIKYNKSKKIDELTWDDIKYVHDGWLEHAVRKNNASQEKYLEAAKFLAKYVIKAQEESCFKDGKGLGFLVNHHEDHYIVGLWSLRHSFFGNGSVLVRRTLNDGENHFLRIALKIDYANIAYILGDPKFNPELLARELEGPTSLQNFVSILANYFTINLLENKR